MNVNHLRKSVTSPSGCFSLFFVIPLGFEPKTYCLEGSCSNPTELRNHTTRCTLWFENRLQRYTFFSCQPNILPQKYSFLVMSSLTTGIPRCFAYVAYCREWYSLPLSDSYRQYTYEESTYGQAWYGLATDHHDVYWKQPD